MTKQSAKNTDFILLNLILNQDCQATWKTGKNQEIWKLTDWQLPIEWTSLQCWKQNVRNFSLESYIWNFFVNSQKCTNYLLFNSRKYTSRSPQNFGLPIPNFRIFFYLFVILDQIMYHKTNIKILPNFHEIITYLRKKIAHFKKYLTGKVHSLPISPEFSLIFGEIIL